MLYEADADLIRQVMVGATGQNIHNINNEIMAYTGYIILLNECEKKIRLYGRTEHLSEQFEDYKRTILVHETKLRQRIQLERMGRFQSFQLQDCA